MYGLWTLLLLSVAAAQNPALWQQNLKTVKVPGPRMGEMVGGWRRNLCLAGGREEVCDITPATVHSALSASGLGDNPVTGSCEVDMAFVFSSIQAYLNATATQYSPKCVADPKCPPHQAAIAASLIWSLNQIDSFGKMEAGLLEGNSIFLGNYQECRGISIPRPGKADYTTKGCAGIGSIYDAFAHLIPNNGKINPGGSFVQANPIYPKPSPNCANLATGTVITMVCLPHSCTDIEATILLQILTNNNGTTPFCAVKCIGNVEDMPYSTGATIITTVLSCFAVVSLLCALVDYFYHAPMLADPKTKESYSKSMGVCMKAIVGFSCYSNAKKILDMTQRPGQIDCLHGIRFLSMSWVIMGHSYSLLTSLPNVLENIGEVVYIKDQIMSQTILNATFSVDSFFLMSGMLVSFLWMKAMIRSKGKLIRNPFTWFSYYVHRYLRLTPLYVIIVSIAVFLVPYWTFGALHLTPETAPGYGTCNTSWWTNLLYINNIVYAKSNEQCYGVAWYLANDMQFYVFAPILLVSLY